MVMDGTNHVVWQGETSPFGTYVYTSGAISDPDLHLPGQWLEAGSGLYQNWYRDYDATIGRYVEADPLGIYAGQSVYAYVANDPVNAIDPLGLDLRMGYNPAFGGVGTHTFLYSTEYGRPIGRNGAYGRNSGDGAPSTIEEARQFPYVKIDIPRGKTEEEVWACIERYEGWEKGIYTPWVDDCQTQAREALAVCGISNPPLVPGGRTPIDENMSRPFVDAEREATRRILNRYLGGYR
jgi:RHS repeat-associated protein